MHLVVDCANHNIRHHCGGVGRRAVLPTTRRKGAHPRRSKCDRKCWYGESWVRLLKGDAFLKERKGAETEEVNEALEVVLVVEEIRSLLPKVMQGRRRSSFCLERTNKKRDATSRGRAASYDFRVSDPRRSCFFKEVESQSARVTWQRVSERTCANEERC